MEIEPIEKRQEWNKERAASDLFRDPGLPSLRHTPAPQGQHRSGALRGAGSAGDGDQ